MEAAKDKALSEPIDLVLALGHEIGNLLAATRLHAHLIHTEMTEAELSELSATIGELSSRMGSLLAQIRPLVSPVSGDAPHVDLVGVLDGVRCGVEESCDARVAVDLESAAGLPMAAIDPEPLHHILLTAVYQALDESAPTGRVAVSAVAQAESITIRVDGGGMRSGHQRRPQGPHALERGCGCDSSAAPRPDCAPFPGRGQSRRADRTGGSV